MFLISKSTQASKKKTEYKKKAKETKEDKIDSHDFELIRRILI